MPNTYQGLDGRPLIERLRRVSRETVVEVRSLLDDERLPIDLRRSERKSGVRAIESSIEEARRAFLSWYTERQQDAQVRLHADYESDTARQTFLNELSDARERGRAVGTRVIDGNVVENAGAFDLADQARDALANGNAKRARVLAQASLDLGGPRLAEQVLESAELTLFPERARALGDIEALDRIASEFVATSEAVTAEVNGMAADAAQKLGDDPTPYRKAQTRSSMAAKMATYRKAKADGEAFSAPQTGVVDVPRDERGPRTYQLTPTGDPVHNMSTGNVEVR